MMVQRVGLGVLLLGVLLMLWPTPALACSGHGLPEEETLIRSTDAVIAGRITDWAVVGPPIEGTHLPIRVTIEVERVFKGNVPEKVYLIDTRVLYLNRHDNQPINQLIWLAGTCGPFEDDPRGMYTIMGINRLDSGAYESWQWWNFFLGPKPEGRGYERALERITAVLGPGTLPAAGAPRSRTAPLLILSGALLLVVAALIRGKHAHPSPSPDVRGRGH